MRWFLVALVIVLRFFGTEARAQAPGSPQALQAAQALVAVLSGDMVTQMSRAMTGQIWPKIEAQFGPKTDAATMMELRTEFEKALENFVRESLKDAPALYAKYFSAKELQDIGAFYKTPSGAKSLELMPTVTAEFFGLLMPRMQAFSGTIEATIARVLEKHGFKP
jgi:uncharacterized protein